MNLADSAMGESLLDALHQAAVRNKLPYRFVCARPLPALDNDSTKIYIQFQIDGVDFSCDTLPIGVSVSDPNRFKLDLFNKVFVEPHARHDAAAQEDNADGDD